jgi:hypothetical protein
VTQNVFLVLGALVLLQVKHFICDFAIQTPYQFLNKGIYGHPGGLIHAGLHAGTGALVFFIITPPLGLGIAIVIAEFVLHYHIDWLKEQTVKRRQWAFPHAEFWWAFGFDQFLHQFTYLGIVAVLAISRGL